MTTTTAAVIAVAEGPEGARVGLLALSDFYSRFGVVLFDIKVNSVPATVIPDQLHSRVAGAFSAVNYGCGPSARAPRGQSSGRSSSA